MNMIKGQLNDLIRYRDLLKNLVKKNIKLKYRRSFLGYIWSILNPLLIMIILAIVFSQMFNRNVDNFPLYLFTGLLLFNFMNQTTSQSIFSVVDSAALLKKVYVPKYVFVVARVTSGLVDLGFSMAALVLIMLFTRASFSWINLLCIFPVLQVYIFSLGLSLFLAQANVFFRDIQHIYSAVTTAWLYVTPIFYPMEMLPENVRFLVEHFNPMYFYIVQFRAFVYDAGLPESEFVVKGCITAVFFLLIGIVSFKKGQDKFILYI